MVFPALPSGGAGLLRETRTGVLHSCDALAVGVVFAVCGPCGVCGQDECDGVNFLTAFAPVGDAGDLYAVDVVLCDWSFAVATFFAASDIEGDDMWIGCGVRSAPHIALVLADVGRELVVSGFFPDSVDAGHDAAVTILGDVALTDVVGVLRPEVAGQGAGTVGSLGGGIDWPEDFAFDLFRGCDRAVLSCTDIDARFAVGGDAAADGSVGDHVPSRETACPACGVALTGEPSGPV